MMELPTGKTVGESKKIMAKLDRETFRKITSIREMTDHLERSDARALRSEVIEQMRILLANSFSLIYHSLKA